jgi:hypothetical protein
VSRSCGALPSQQSESLAPSSKLAAPSMGESVFNLVHYLAVRRHDVRATSRRAGAPCKPPGRIGKLGEFETTAAYPRGYPGIEPSDGQFPSVRRGFRGLRVYPTGTQL